MVPTDYRTLVLGTGGGFVLWGIPFFCREHGALLDARAKVAARPDPCLSPENPICLAAFLVMTHIFPSFAKFRSTILTGQQAHLSATLSVVGAWVCKECCPANFLFLLAMLCSAWIAKAFKMSCQWLAPWATNLHSSACCPSSRWSGPRAVRSWLQGSCHLCSWGSMLQMVWT